MKKVIDETFINSIVFEDKNEYEYFYEEVQEEVIKKVNENRTDNYIKFRQLIESRLEIKQSDYYRDVIQEVLNKACSIFIYSIANSTLEDTIKYYDYEDDRFEYESFVDACINNVEEQIVHLLTIKNDVNFDKLIQISFKEVLIDNIENNYDID